MSEELDTLAQQVKLDGITVVSEPEEIVEIVDVEPLFCVDVGKIVFLTNPVDIPPTVRVVERQIPYTNYTSIIATYDIYASSAEDLALAVIALCHKQPGQEPGTLIEVRAHLPYIETEKKIRALFEMEIRDRRVA